MQSQDINNAAEYNRHGFTAVSGKVNFVYKLDVKAMEISELQKHIAYLVIIGYTVRLMAGSQFLYWGA